MNFIVIPARAQCIKCSNIQETGRDYCSACGASFIFGKPDAWERFIYQDESGLEFIRKMMEESPGKVIKTEYPCMWDNVPPGQAMGMVCNCPKCAIT